jgi:hypothetical protein
VTGQLADRWMGRCAVGMVSGIEVVLDLTELDWYWIRLGLDFVCSVQCSDSDANLIISHNGNLTALILSIQVARCPPSCALRSLIQLRNKN